MSGSCSCEEDLVLSLAWRDSTRLDLRGRHEGQEEHLRREGSVEQKDQKVFEQTKATVRHQQMLRLQQALSQLHKGPASERHVTKTFELPSTPSTTKLELIPDNLTRFLR